MSPEIRADRFEPRLIGNAGEIAGHGIDARQLRAETARLGPALEAAARRMFGEWLDQVEATPRPWLDCSKSLRDAMLDRSRVLTGRNS